jgi:hypothetical protein
VLKENRKFIFTVLKNTETACPRAIISDRTCYYLSFLSATISKCSIETSTGVFKFKVTLYSGFQNSKRQVDEKNEVKNCIAVDGVGL